MTELLKISQGRVVNPREFVRTALSDLIEQAGGVNELRKVLDACDEMPQRALEIALRRARDEYIVASLGESLVGMSVLMGLFWLMAPDVELSTGLVAKLFVPAAIALVIHVGIQWHWHTSWYRATLYPAFKRRSREQVVSAALSFYTTVAPGMTIPGTLLYPLATGVTLGLVGASPSVWLVLVLSAVVVGAAVNQLLYFTRLLHTDLCEWAGAFSLECTPEDVHAIQEARKGTGWYRRIWESFEARGYSSLSRFQVYVLGQCALGIVASVVICVALVRIGGMPQRALVAVPLGLGLLAIGRSYFMRFVFLNRQQPLPELRPATGEVVARPAPTYESITESGVEARSRELRRAML